MLIRTFKFHRIMMSLHPLHVVCLLFLFWFVQSASPDDPVTLAGYYAESDKVIYTSEESAFSFPKGDTLKLMIFGGNFADAERILFTKQKYSENRSCDSMDHTASFALHELTSISASASVGFKTDSGDPVTFYMCLRDKNGKYHHLGDLSKIIVKDMSGQIMPIPLQIALVCMCFMLSSIFSGLNLGLMALDVGELKLIMKVGSEEDKKYARAILPIRKRGNTLLCTLLFGNTIVNASLTLLLDNLIGQGLYALIGSTVGILIFGEIVPQSICSRYGLRIGYYCRYVVLFFMFGLFPITFSLGKLLDLILGREIHQVYSRAELREMVKMSYALDGSHSSSDNEYPGGRSGLKREEFNIVTGALEITEATVDTIMKPKDEIFMLDISVAIDYDLIELITQHGYTRIPIYANDKNNIVGLLSTKDLLGIDPEDKLPLNSLVEYYPRSILRVLGSTTILDMLNLFKSAKVHLAIVDTIVCDEEHDPIKEMIGIVTLEDVIEFILREEIDDETDDLKKRRKHDEKVGNRAVAAPFKRDETIPQQLNTAAVQFLIANVEAFRKEIVERKVLANLLRFPGTFIVKKHTGKFAGHVADNTLYSADKEADYFILILQGTCQVFIGRERLPFEAGPFHYFGLEALIGVGNVPLTSPGPSSPGSSPQSFDNSPSKSKEFVSHHQLDSALASHSSDYYDATVTLSMRKFNRTGSKAQRILSNLTQMGHKDRTSSESGPAQSTSNHNFHNKHSMPYSDDEGSHSHRLTPRYASRSSINRHGSITSLGSVHPAYQYSRKNFVPDFSVEITNDVQFVRLTNSHYRALLTVTQLVRRKNKLDDTAFILDKLRMELLREGEQYPNFEIIAPPRHPSSHGTAHDVVSLGSGARVTPPATLNPTIPLRVSVPSDHSWGLLEIKKDLSHPELQLTSPNDTSYSLSPGRLRHASPLHAALLNNSRHTSASAHSPLLRRRSATSGDCEPSMVPATTPSPSKSATNTSDQPISEVTAPITTDVKE